MTTGAQDLGAAAPTVPRDAARHTVMKSKGTIMRNLLQTVVTLLLLGAGRPPEATAQVTTGTIAGAARGVDDDAPIPFAMIRLVRWDAAVPTLRTVLADAQGRFSFADVAPGEYVLQVDRVGIQRVLSPVVRLSAGQTVHHDLRAAATPVLLPAVVSRPGASCLGVDDLAQVPEVATVWQEARKGVETRREFELQYRFVRTLRQDITIANRFRRDSWRVRIDTLLSEPDSVQVRDARRLARHRAQGYASGSSLSVPDEKELLDDGFLRDHCLATTADTTEGALVLSFRPVAARESGAGLRGRILLEPNTYVVRRLEFEFLDRDRTVAESSIEYADLPVGTARLRLPSGGHAVLHPSGVTRALYSGASARLAYTYSDFTRVGGR